MSCIGAIIYYVKHKQTYVKARKAWINENIPSKE